MLAKKKICAPNNLLPVFPRGIRSFVNETKSHEKEILRIHKLIRQWDESRIFQKIFLEKYSRATKADFWDHCGRVLRSKRNFKRHLDLEFFKLADLWVWIFKERIFKRLTELQTCI